MKFSFAINIERIITDLHGCRMICKLRTRQAYPRDSAARRVYKKQEILRSAGSFLWYQILATPRKLDGSKTFADDIDGAALSAMMFPN